MTVCFFNSHPDDFKKLLNEKGYPDFRAKQISEWVWKKGVTDPIKMKNLPMALRQQFTVHSMSCDLRLQSSDGTIKRRLKLKDGEFVESVSIPIKGQWTVCVSSQTGCAMGCRFCATGLKKRFRNLSGLEIVEQALWHWQDTGEKPSRIVFMGMGEPLSNRNAVEEAINLLTQKLDMSSRRLTVSTVGMVEGIRWLAEIKPPVNLALSLHSASDTTRQELVPTARSCVDELVSECYRFREKTGRDVTFEVVLLAGMNDDDEHARNLAAKAGQGIMINLIPYNSGGAGDFSQPTKERLKQFCAILKNAKVNHSIRTPRGQDINAACGELTIGKNN